MEYSINNKVVEVENKKRVITILNEDTNSQNKINKFSKENAVFNGKKIKYNNENRYVLKPVQ